MPRFCVRLRLVRMTSTEPLPMYSFEKWLMPLLSTRFQMSASALGEAKIAIAIVIATDKIIGCVMVSARASCVRVLGNAAHDRAPNAARLTLTTSARGVANKVRARQPQDRQS